MKITITELGVYDQNGDQIEVGTVVDVKGDTVPGWLVNKGEVLADAKGKTAVTNPAKTKKRAGLEAQAEAGGVAHEPDMSDDDLITAIKAAKVE